MKSVKLFVCSGCSECEAAITFMEMWQQTHPNCDTQIVSIFDDPREVVILGIKSTPALVIDDELIGQELSVEALDRHLKQVFDIAT